MRKHTVNCDHCNAIIDQIAPAMFNGVKPTTPIRIQKQRSRNGCVIGCGEYDFCNDTCLIKWLKEKIPTTSCNHLK